MKSLYCIVSSIEVTILSLADLRSPLTLWPTIRPMPGTRVPGDPTHRPGTRPMNRVPGSVLPVLLPEFILINTINKTDRKTYHWKWQNISFATRYPLN